MNVFDLRNVRGPLCKDLAGHYWDEVARQRADVAISSFEECVREDLEDTTSSPPAPPPVTHAQLSAWCLAHPAPGMRIVSTPAPGANIPIQDGTRPASQSHGLTHHRTSGSAPPRKSSQSSAANWLIVTLRPAPLRMGQA